MATIKLDMTAIREESARGLADRIGCTVPDSPDSPGAKLLIETRDQVLTHVKQVLADDYEPNHVTESDRLSDIENAALPDNIDIDGLWRQYVDLGGWQGYWQDYSQETLRGLVDTFRYRQGLPTTKDLPTMTDLARSGLYMIVNALIFQLVAELQQQYDTIEPEEEDDDA